MVKNNQRLISTLGFGWLSLLITGFIIQAVSKSPTITILIDRSYCPQNQWQKLADNYRDFYQQNQLKSIEIEKVILFSDLGEEVLTIPPEPDKIKEISLYGKANPQRQEQIKTSYPQGKLLICQ